MDRVTANLHHLLFHWSFALATVFLCSTLYAQNPIVDQSNLPAWDGKWANVLEGNNVTQTFTPQLRTLTGVDIDLVTGNPQYGADVVTVEILRGTASLVSISQLVAAGFEGLLHFGFSAPIPTNPGETLKLVVKDTTLTIGWKYGSNTYAGGMYIYYGVSHPEYDFFFQTYGYPEPGDLNGDGKTDILWRHKTTGELAAWYMNGVNFISPVGIAMVDPVWEIVGTPDLNGDSKADFLWRHKTTGELAAWYMNGVNFISPVGIATVAPIWELVAPK